MKALIVGAGIAGLAASKFLTDIGWEVTIVEKARGPRTSGYMIDFAGSGYDAVERAGLLPRFIAKHHQIDAVEYVDTKGHTRSIIDYKLTRETMRGRLLALLRGDIEQILLDAQSKAVDIRYSMSVDEITDHGDSVEAVLTDGSRVTADLLIGADGIHSHVRGLVFGREENYLRYLGYHVSAFMFEDPAISADLRGGFKILTVPDRQFALYALDDGRLATFDAHKDASRERPAKPAARLREVYGDLGWHLPSVLDHADHCDDIYYDWIAQIEMDQWHKGRVVLVGDSAYAVSLLAGQGASMAIGGAFVLAQLLAKMPVPEALASFETRLHKEVLEKQASGRRTANWFVPPTEFHNKVRDVFLNATRLPGLSWLLRNFFAPSLKSVVRE
ncbi:MAG: FAD-dependent monooxygenase [Hyphomicrobiaceae bacterium]|nr:FAD-dependent monooxygenase [Hyphomicrobiaceae bacterium]